MGEIATADGVQNIAMPGLSPMEPAGIEPATSCLQSRRIEVDVGEKRPVFRLSGVAGFAWRPRMGNTLRNTPL